MTAPTGTEATTARIAEALGQHTFHGGFMTVEGWVKPQCLCGHVYDNPNASEFYSHPLHVAALLSAGVIRDMQAAALREAADDAEAGRGPAPKDPHPSWPSLAEWLRDRATRIEEGRHA